MESFEKVNLLSQAAQWDVCSTCLSEKLKRRRSPFGRWIYPAVMPDGRRILLLKVLLSNVCENDCYYCAFRRSRNYRRAGFTPEELAKLFMELRQRGLAQGLFLSSGVFKNPKIAMDRMLACVEILRTKYKFPGYIHLKILPGVDSGSIERAVRLASRVSINIEAPSDAYLKRIAKDKDFHKDILERMGLIKRFIEKEDRRVSQTTQFVVGASEERDRDILKTTTKLYKEFGLNRVYYSAFQPISDTPLEQRPPTPLLREHRLYQVDFLFRRYGFSLEEIPFDKKGDLSLEEDPKLRWAKLHPDYFPLDPNRASKEELLRVPGIGPITAQRLIRERRRGEIRYIEDLASLGVLRKRAVPFLIIKEKFQKQLSFAL